MEPIVGSRFNPILASLCPEVNEHLIFKCNVKKLLQPKYQGPENPVQHVPKEKLAEKFSCVNYTCEIYWCIERAPAGRKMTRICPVCE